MKYIKLTFLILLFGCSSNKPQWSDNHKYFLTALTYSDNEWSPTDFGKATNEEEKELLQKFLPKVYISQGNLVPIDFYKDYLPKTVLKNSSAKIIDKAISRQKLKSVEREAGFYLDYQGEYKKCLTSCQTKKRTIYGRVFYEKMQPPKKNKKESAIDFIILKYNLVFPTSGLPQELSWYKNLGLALIGDKEDWHQLDIHGAIQIFIEKKTAKPAILLLAQHNHFRSYIINKDVMLPKDNRIAICIAKRSNEPYPCPEISRHFRTVGNPSNYAYVLGASAPLFDGGYDLVSARKESVELNLKLQFLPDKDPLYTSWIELGDKKKLFGIIPSFFRNGPPGINMNTTPKTKKYTDLAKIWYVSESDKKQIDFFNDMGDFFNPNVAPLLDYNGSRLWLDLAKTQKRFNH